MSTNTTLLMTGMTERLASDASRKLATVWACTPCMKEASHLYSINEKH